MTMAATPWAAAEFGIRQVLMPKLQYSLVVTTLTETQCNEIMKPVLQAGLPAMGINWNFPRAVVHGPVEYQGLNLPNLYSEQLITQIGTMLKYGPQQTDPTRVLIRANGELEAGVCGPLFCMSPYLQPCLTKTWMSLCWFQCIQQGSFLDTDIQDFKPIQQGDSTLMEQFFCASYREMELTTLNCCCMYLHIIFLSDICNGSGTTTETDFWNCAKPVDIHQYHWLQIHPPSPTEQLLWQQGLTCSLNLGSTQILPIPLGKWMHQVCNRDSWFMSPGRDKLYHQHLLEWTTYSLVPWHNRTKSFHDMLCQIPKEDIPKEMVKAMLYKHGSILMVTGYDQIELRDTQQTPSPTKRLWMECWCEQQLVGEEDILVQAIQQGLAVEVSNRPFQEQQGVAAWTIEGKSLEHKLNGASLTMGSLTDQSTYWSELFGLWGILATIHCLTLKHQIVKGMVVVACNSLSALKKASSPYPTDPNENHYDIIST